MSSAAVALTDPEVKAEWEKEAATTLKKLGFPGMETASNAMVCLPKVTSCITRRLKFLGDFIHDMEKAEKEQAKEAKASNKEAQSGTILSKIFGFIFMCTVVCNSVARVKDNFSCRLWRPLIKDDNEDEGNL